MRKNILIGIDLDGTLLTSKKQITGVTRETLADVIKKGVRIVPVTGRPISGLPDALCEIPGIQYVITNNGAVIYDLSNEKIIYEESIPMKICIEIYDMTFQYADAFEVFLEGVGMESAASYSWLTERFRGKAIMGYLEKSRRCVTDLRAYLTRSRGAVDGISLMCGKKSDCEIIKQQLQKFDGICVIEEAENELELHSLHAGKGNALVKLGERLGIQQEDIVAIGDGNNDIDMFRKAGTAIAMENATPNLKRFATDITLSNEKDGVAWAIRKVCSTMLD